MTQQEQLQYVVGCRVKGITAPEVVVLLQSEQTHVVYLIHEEGKNTFRG